MSDMDGRASWPLTLLAIAVVTVAFGAMVLGLALLVVLP